MSPRFHSPPDRKPGPDRGRSGSMLAETLLVLPLYLMLLGGLFIVGDLLLARIRGGMLDRTAAWLRPGGAFATGTIAGHHRVWEGTKTPFGWYGMKLGDPADSSISPIRSWGVKIEDNAESDVGEGVPTQGNRWVGFYQGVSFVSAGVPFWVFLLDSQQAVHPDESGSGEKTRSLYRVHEDHPGWSGSGSADARFGRSYVFTRRNANMTDPPPPRSVSIRDLQKSDGGYQDIVLDSWPCISGLVGVRPVPIPDEYVRNATAKTLAEQSFGSILQ